MSNGKPAVKTAARKNDSAPTRRPARADGTERLVTGLKRAVAIAPEIAATLVAARRNDVTAIREAGLKSYAGIETVLQHHRDILRDALGELKAVAKVMHTSGARENMSNLRPLGRGAVDLTLESIRELATLAAATQHEALKLIEKRVKKEIAELKRLQQSKSVPKSH